MSEWQIAIVPPLLVWCGLFLYLLSVDARLKRVEKSLKEPK